MAFHERMYQCFVILGDPQFPPIWEWNRWQTLALLLDPIIGLARDKALVRSGQFHRGNKGALKEVKFGRLGWSAKYHERWVHDSPATRGKCEEWDFFFLEASAPSFPQCYQEGIPPDAFLTITNEGYITKEIPLLFNPSVFLALAEQVASRREKVVRNFLEQASALLGAKLVCEIRRPWGISPGGTVYQDGIQAIAHTGLFKVGQRHARPLDLQTFQEAWQCVRSAP